MPKVILYGMPPHELLARARVQGLWPIEEKYHGQSTEQIIRAMSYDTRHSVRYIRAVFKHGARLDPSNWPALTDTARVSYNDPSVGRGKFTNKPNPKVRAGIQASAELRQAIINYNDKHTIRHPDLPVIRTNATQLERVKDNAPVLTNGRMRPKSKNTTAYSTGFAPPSRKDQTKLVIKDTTSRKRFSKT